MGPFHLGSGLNQLAKILNNMTVVKLVHPPKVENNTCLEQMPGPSCSQLKTKKPSSYC